VATVESSESRERKARTVRTSEGSAQTAVKHKKEAATYLGVSTRTLENYVKRGELGVRKMKGATGDVAVYDDDELRRLKAKIDGKRAPHPVVVRDEPNGNSESLAMMRGSISHLSPLDLMAAISAATVKERQSTPVVTIGEKVMLTLLDAAALTSLSVNHLREAIKAGILKGKIIGRGWKVKRTDLDAYVKSL
jgi:excisionase family DNA binding protein